MRIAGTLSILLLSASGCLPPPGAALPPNVGANHPEGDPRGVRRTPAPPAEPLEVGTPVWADFHASGFHFHGVVVERREDMHRVIYDDGAGEWVPASALLPDTLGEEALVHARASYEEEFQSASVARRLGQALYVRLAGGDERWTTLPHVRFQAGSGPGAPVRGEPAPSPAPAPAGQPGSDVLVNYQFQGLRFGGTITALGDDGRVHVVYLDGESEWVPPSVVSPDDVGEGTIVHVRRSWEPPVWVRGRVQRRVGSALQVALDDGGLAWTAMFRVRVPVPEPPPRAVPPPEPEPAPSPPEPRTRRRRPRS